MDDYIIYDGELYHYGRKGMKWGVRRTAAQLGHVVKAGYKKTKTAVDNHKAKKAAKKAAEVAAKRAKITSSRKLTNEELEARIKRLELEKRYVDLVKDTSQVNAGKKFASSIIETSGKNLAAQVLNHYGSKMLNRLIGDEVIYANNKKK